MKAFRTLSQLPAPGSVRVKDGHVNSALTEYRPPMNMCDLQLRSCT